MSYSKTTLFLGSVLCVLFVGMVSANLIPDGDLASGTVKPANNNDRFADQEAHVDDGFFYGSWTEDAWTVTGGRLVRDFSLSGNSPRGVGAIWNAEHAAGNYALQFDYEWDSTDTTGNLIVEIYSYRDLGLDAHSIWGLVYADRMEVGNSHTFTPINGGNSNFEKTLLSSVNLATYGVTTGVETYQLAFVLAEPLLAPAGDFTYGDRLALRIYAENLGGDASGLLAFDNFQIVAASGPVITSHPASTTIMLGATADLEVAATTESGPLTYQWYEGPSGNMSAPVADATNTLFTTPVFATTGPRQFWVRVTDQDGSANSMAATVTVLSDYDGIPDGDFASGQVQAAPNGRISLESQVDEGFYFGVHAGEVGQVTWGVDEGRLVRFFDVLGNHHRAVGAIWNADHVAGDYALEFDYEWNGVIKSYAEGELLVQLFLYEDLGANRHSNQGLVYDDRLNLANGEDMPSNGPSSNFEKSLIAQVDLATLGAATTTAYRLNFTLDDDLQMSDGEDILWGDRLAVRITLIDLAGDAQDGFLAFDNFRVVSLDDPEPPAPEVVIPGFTRNPDTNAMDISIPDGHALALVEGATELIGHGFNWEELTLNEDYTVNGGVVSITPTEDVQMIRILVE